MLIPALQASLLKGYIPLWKYRRLFLFQWFFYFFSYGNHLSVLNQSLSFPFPLPSYFLRCGLFAHIKNIIVLQPFENLNASNIITLHMLPPSHLSIFFRRKMMYLRPYPKCGRFCMRLYYISLFLSLFYWMNNFLWIQTHQTLLPCICCLPLTSLSSSGREWGCWEHVQKCGRFCICLLSLSFSLSLSLSLFLSLSF